jgi:ribosomal protein L11 methyltransferase
VFHRPVRIGRLWIGPPWESPPPDASAVTIDPGRAFGTGAHPTTRLCLELLLELERGSVVDLGCGSGVLAIAAVKLGFGPVVAVDADTAAVEAARTNAAANGVSLEVREADVFIGTVPDADAALANISLEAVERLGPHLRASAFVASGYLERDEPTLPPFRRVERRVADRWAADLYVRK